MSLSALLQTQSMRCELLAGGGEVEVLDGADAEAARDLDEHFAVLEVEDVTGGDLRDVERGAVDVGVGFAEVDVAGRDEEVDKTVELEFADAVGVKFAAFVADDGDLEPMLGFEGADVLDHVGQGLRLREHELAEIGDGEVALAVEDDALEIFLERELAFLIRIEGEVMTLRGLFGVEAEVLHCAGAGGAVPAVGEEDAADVDEEGGDGCGAFHVLTNCRHLQGTQAIIMGLISGAVDNRKIAITFFAMNTLLKVLCVAVLASFATVSLHAQCSGGGCSGKDKKKTEDKGK